MLKKSATYICMLLIGVLGFFGVYNHALIGSSAVGQVYAAEPFSDARNGTYNPPADSTQSAEMQKMLQNLVAALNIILDILTILVTPAIVLASWLMSPDWTSGDLFQIRPMIHSLWVTVSNITYFVYAILLIFIALATIFNSENYGYKQLLPKLALGILMVPLSWWFIQFTISLATLVTASVVSIPAEVVINYTKDNAQSFWTDPIIPETTKFNNDKLDKSNSKVPCEGSVAAQNAEVDNGQQMATQKCITPENFIKNSGGMYSSLMIYSFAIFRFQDIKELPTTANKIQSIGQIINQGLIGAIMFIVYGFLVLALIFMLLIRAIKLWFYAIFSPLMTLKFVLGDKLFGKEGGDTFDLKEFIGLAFVPAVVGLCLSFGLVIVSVMMKPVSNVTKDCSTTECSITLFGNDENKLTTKKDGNKTTTTVKIGGASYIFTGDVTSGNTTGNIASALNIAGGIMGTIILNIIALIFIWVAFMAGKGVSKAVSAAVAPFESMGKKIGEFATSLPKYAPILPGGMSMSGATGLMSDVEGKISSNSRNKAQNSALGQALGLNTMASGNSTTYTDKAVDTMGQKDAIKSVENLKLATISLQKDLEAQKDIKTEVAKIAEALRVLRKDAPDTYKTIVESGQLGINKNDLRNVLDRVGEKKIEKNDHALLNELQTIIVGNKTQNAGGKNSESVQFKGEKDAVDATKHVIQFNDDIRVRVNNEGIGMDPAMVDKLKKFASEMTEEDFKKRFSGAYLGFADKIIKEGKLEFKKKDESPKS